MCVRERVRVCVSCCISPLNIPDEAVELVSERNGGAVSKRSCFDFDSN